jgi:TPR repeat protein
MKTLESKNIINSVEKKLAKSGKLGLFTDDLKRHALYYRQAAHAGDPAAQVYLGHCYHEGWGVKANLVLSAKWYRKAAEQNDYDGYYYLGNCYFHGWGVAKDMDESLRLFRIAAEHGIVAAMFQVAVAYEFGWGVEMNKAETMRILQRLAREAEFAKAQYHLALCYLFGECTQVDRNAALYWLEKALAQPEDLPEDLVEIGEMKLAQLRSEGYSSTWEAIKKNEQPRN